MNCVWRRGWEAPLRTPQLKKPTPPMALTLQAQDSSGKPREWQWWQWQERL